MKNNKVLFKATMITNRLVSLTFIFTFWAAIAPDSLSGGEPSPLFSDHDSLQLRQTRSFKSDLLRSAVGSAVGGIVGAALGGVIPIWLDGDYGRGSFPDNSFYLSTYMGAGVFAALSSATALYLSKDRDISWWGLASYSLLPPMILVMPLSVYASIQDRNELVRAAWVATITSIGVSTVWNALVYRMYPPRKDNRIAIRFAKPYLRTHRDVHLNTQMSFGMNFVEIHF